MLFEALKNDPVVSKYIRPKCCDNNIEVSISSKIPPEDILIIKVDDFYNNEFPPEPHPPKSPDCLIIVKCLDHYEIYIVELRNTSTQRGFTVGEIELKFSNCLGDFMSERVGHVFQDDHIDIRRIKLYFVSDPFDYKNRPDKKELYDMGRKANTLRANKLEILMQVRLSAYFGRPWRLYIDHHIPNPVIPSCQ